MFNLNILFIAATFKVNSEDNIKYTIFTTTDIYNMSLGKLDIKIII